MRRLISGLKRPLDRAIRALAFRWLQLSNRSPRSFQSAAAIAVRSDPDRIGVDIFDTIAVRRLAGDTASEVVAANRIAEGVGWPAHGWEYLAALRFAQRKSGSLALKDWLEVLGELHGLDVHAAYEHHLDAERDLIRPVPGAREALETLRARAPLTFVSDMHFHSADLRSLLEPFELISPDEPIAVSSDYGVSKADGKLFAAAGDGAAPQGHVVFIGNDLWSDVAQARRASLQAVPAAAANLTRFEAAMATNPRSLGPAIAGSARLQRLGSLPDAGLDARITELGGQVIGQAMLAFLLWVRSECLSRDIDQIAFLARDGELPLQMAREMPPDHWAGTQLRYLHCGRRAWSLAAAPIVGIEAWIDVGTADAAAFLIHSSTATPFQNLLDRCGLDIRQLPSECPLASRPVTTPLSADESDVWSDLLRRGDLHDAILAAAQEPRRLLIDFLTQMKLGHKRLALVDVGWRGQQAWLISALVREATGAEPLHLHFGGDRVVTDLDDEVDIERFAFDDLREPHPVSSPVACVEMFLASGKPRLLGYSRDEGGAVSEQFEERPTSVANKTRTLAAQGAIEIARLFPSRAELTAWDLCEAPLIEETRSLLAMFWNSPTRREADILSGLQFEGDDSGSIVGPVIREYSPAEIVERRDQPRVWREASLRVTPLWFRSLLKLYFSLRSRFGR